MNTYLFASKTIPLQSLIGNPLDMSKPIDKAIYFLLVGLAELLWWFNRAFLTVASLLRELHRWMVSELADLAGVIIENFGPILAFSLVLAASVYGVSRVLSSFFDFAEPVDAGKAIRYGIIGLFYISSATSLIQMVEDARTLVGDAVYGVAFGPVQSGISGMVGAVGGTGIPIQSNPGLDGDPSGLSGWDVAATFLGVGNSDELASPQLPMILREGYLYTGQPDCCFMYAYNASGFDALDDTERSAAISSAYDGIMVLFMAPVPISYAIAEEFVKMMLTAVAFTLYVSFPIGFVFSPFRLTAGVLSGYVNRYAQLIAETVVTAVFLAIGSALVATTPQLPTNAFLAICIVAFLIALWRGISATKLAAMAVGGMVGGVTQAADRGSALSVGDMKNVGTGVVMGGAMVAIGAATGNPMLAGSGLARAAGAAGGAMSPNGSPSAGGMGMGQMLMAGGLMQSLQGGGGGGQNVAVDDGGVSAMLAGGAPDNAPPTFQDGGAMIPEVSPEEYARIRGRDSLRQPSTPQSNQASGRMDASSNGAQGNVNPPMQTGLRGNDVNRWADYVNNSAGSHVDEQKALQMGRREFGPAAESVSKIAQTDAGLQGVKEAAGQINFHSELFNDNGDELVDWFRSGEAHKIISDKLPEDSPFQDADNFYDLADMVVTPQQDVSHNDVLGAIASSAGTDNYAASASSELGMPQTFGAYDGSAQAIGETAYSIGALAPDPAAPSATYLETAGEQIAQGNMEAAQTKLTQAASESGGNFKSVSQLMGDLDASNSYFANPRPVPQTTRPKTGVSYQSQSPKVQGQLTNVGSESSKKVMNG